MNKLLDNEVALITGGASGLGSAIAARFLKEGARVAVLDASKDRLAELQRTLGSSVLAIHGDVRNYEDNVMAVERTVKEWGRLSIVIANAGIHDRGLSLADIDAAVLSAAFDEIFDVNLRGYIFIAKAALDELRRQRGTLIFTSSVSGMYAGFGGFLYVTTKHAISGLTRQLALELAPEIRVNAVAPGYIKTNLQGLSTVDTRGPPNNADANDPERFPLKTVPRIEDYAGIYAMIASRHSATVMTGSVVLVDAGASLRNSRMS